MPAPIILPHAASVPYDSTSSSLSANTVQEAIDLIVTSVSGLQPKQDVITLSSGDISAKKVVLSATPSFTNIFLQPEGGIPQVYGEDFILINGNEISWDGLGLDGFLEAGERLFISYVE
jgi:hypothetical protein